LISVLVDSGSDTNCFNTQIADALGIDWKHCPEVRYKGISGGTSGFIHEVRVEIGGYSYEADAVFIENLPRLGLLGVYGFLDRFECRLNREQETIEICFSEENGRVVIRAS
jgi:hypothetical protein